MKRTAQQFTVVLQIPNVSKCAQLLQLEKKSVPAKLAFCCMKMVTSKIFILNFNI